MDSYNWICFGSIERGLNSSRDQLPFWGSVICFNKFQTLNYIIWILLSLHKVIRESIVWMSDLHLRWPPSNFNKPEFVFVLARLYFMPANLKVIHLFRSKSVHANHFNNLLCKTIMPINNFPQKCIIFGKFLMIK